jgi:hypothetical protein
MDRNTITETTVDAEQLNNGKNFSFNSLSDIDQFHRVKFGNFVDKTFSSYLERGRIPSESTIEKKYGFFSKALKKVGLGSVPMHVYKSFVTSHLNRDRLFGGVGSDDEEVKGAPSGLRPLIPTKKEENLGIDFATKAAFAGLLTRGGVATAYENLTTYVTNSNFTNLHLFVCIRFALEPASLIATGESKNKTKMPFKYTQQMIDFMKNSGIPEVKGQREPRVGDQMTWAPALALMMPHLSAKNTESAQKSTVMGNNREEQGSAFKRRLQTQGLFGTVNRQMVRRLAHLALYILDRGSKSTANGAISKLTKSEQLEVKGISKEGAAKGSFFSTQNAETKRIANEFIEGFLEEDEYWTEELLRGIKAALVSPTLTKIGDAKPYGLDWSKTLS